MEIVKTLDHIKNLNSPAYIRITIQPKKKNLHTSDYRFSTGSVEKIYGKNDILVLTTGALFINVLEAVERLEHLGYDMSVYNIHTIKPMGKEVEELIKKYQVIVTVEEHNIIGGLGTAVSELASNYNNNKTLKRIGIPDCFFYADVPTELLDIAGISTNKLIGAFLEILNDLSDSKLGEGNSQR